MKNLVEIKNLIYEIRGYKVMLDSDLANLYGVETRVLKQAVKRNIERFPVHYMFQVTKDEFQNLISRNVISSWGGVRKLPYVFTEQGVAMLSSVLKSKQAIQINMQIIDAFVKMRQMVIEHKDLAKRISDLEEYFLEHCNDNKDDIKEIYKAIDLLMERTRPSKIGFNNIED